MKGLHLIHASAGSGKTHRLTRDAVKAIAEGVPADRLMATTFTVRAAAQMRARIRHGLFQAGEPQAAQAVLEGMVGTVNSVSQQLLTEHAVEAGLPPRLQVLEPDEAEHLFHVAVTHVVEAWAPDLEAVAARLGYDGGGSGQARRPDWRDDVHRIMTLARANLMDAAKLHHSAEASWQGLTQVLEPPTSQDLNAALQQALPAAITALQGIIAPKKATFQVLDQLHSIQRALDRAEDPPWSDWVRLSKLKPAKEGQALVAPLIDLGSRVLSHPQLHADLRTLVEGVLACAGEALAAYQSCKRRQGLVDFTDQESLMLSLLREHANVRIAMSSHLDLLLVDEFQDTSPVQLALFMTLNTAVGKSIWVGDPKQAIYGFRGADHELMDQVAAHADSGDILGYSWRSRAGLVDFCNAVFSRAFHERSPREICLDLPEDKETQGGWLEAWHLNASNRQQEVQALAQGVQELLARHPDRRLGDVAILCFQNRHCREVARALEAIGLPASVGQGCLIDTEECRLALAALRYWQDPMDRLALVELVNFLPHQSEHEDWLDQLLHDDTQALITWRQDPLIRALDDAQQSLQTLLTPAEVLCHVMEALGLVTLVQGWPHPQRRLSNLDALRARAQAYESHCMTYRQPATLTGLIQTLHRDESEQPALATDDALQVLTYHGAKGLEWPTVILTGLDREIRETPFCLGMHAAAKLDPMDPLAHRQIHYWPWPFAGQKRVDPVEQRLKGHPDSERIARQAHDEARRLLYVGMTRARDGMILAVRRQVTGRGSKLRTAWLDTLHDANGDRILDLDLEPGEQVLSFSDTALPIQVRVMDEASDASACKPTPVIHYQSAACTGEGVGYPPARQGFSQLESLPEDSVFAHDLALTVKARLGEPITTPVQGADFIHLGNAVHGYLAVALQGSCSNGDLTDLARSLIARWDVTGALAPSSLTDIGERLREYLQAHFPEATGRTEWPVSLRLPNLTRVQGWVDVLLECPEGYIVLDHKTVQSRDVLDDARQHAAQLSGYAQAVATATDKPMIGTWLHYPLQGLIIAVRPHPDPDLMGLGCGPEVGLR